MRTLFLNQVDRVDEFLDVEVDIHPLCEIHGAGVSGDPLDDGRIDTGRGEQRERCVPRAVRRPVDLQILHQRKIVAVVIVPVGEVSTICVVQKVLAGRIALHPALVEGEDFVRNRHFSETVFRLAGLYVEVLLVQMDVFLLQVQHFTDSDPGVDEHQDDLIVRIVFHRPHPVNLFICELVAFPLVRVPVLVLKDVNELRVVLVADQ